MGDLHRLSNSAVPLPRHQLEQMLHAITAMQRVTGEMAVALLASLDRIDGDADDETEALEDDFTPMPSEIDFGPGCEIADSPTDQSYVEWHTKPANTRRRGQPEYTLGEEDSEEDDPAGQYDEDCHTGPRPKVSGAGCPIADPGGCEHDGREPDYCR